MVSKSMANPIPKQFSPKNLNNQDFYGDAGGSTNFGTATHARNSSSNPDGLNNYSSNNLYHEQNGSKTPSNNIIGISPVSNNSRKHVFNQSNGF